MARPIKDTPVLKGKEAERFEEDMEKVGRASSQEIRDAERVYDLFKSISTF